MNINGFTPKKRLNNKTLVTLQNTPTEDIFEILHFAKKIKQMQSVNEKTNWINGKYVALLTKPSYVRSLIGFQIAVNELGGHPITVSLPGSKIEEELKDPDTTTIVQNYGVSAVVVDTEFLHDAEVLENYSVMPVINANGRTSPCQTLSALLAIWEAKGKLQGLKMAIVGEVGNGDYSLIAGAVKCGIDISIICPDGHEPPAEILTYCNQFGFVDVFDHLDDGLRGADIVYIIGHEFGKEFLFTDRYFRYMNKDCILLHSMPINRGVDISEETLNYPNSLIFKQAANVLPVLKAVLALSIGNIKE